jgi:predicted GNAT family acetyltransferase
VDIAIDDHPEESRYVITLDHKVVGFTEYHSRPGLVAFVHTEIDDSASGQGLASKLIKAVLDDARAKGRQVLPFCPFVNSYVSRHPEYVDLVPENHRKEFGL